MRFQVIIGSNKIFEHLVPVALALKFSSFVVCAGITSQRCKHVRSKRNETGERGSSAHVFNMGIQTSVFMNDNNATEFSLSVDWLRQQPLDRSGAFWRRVVDVI